MFLYFHMKYNMILFVSKILDHMHIKTLNFYLFNFYHPTTYIKKYINTPTSLFIMFFSYTHV
jgi:hypothetical protein